MTDIATFDNVIDIVLRYAPRGNTVVRQSVFLDLLETVDIDNEQYTDSKYYDEFEPVIREFYPDYFKE
jgi:hypothetical protein